MNYQSWSFNSFIEVVFSRENQEDIFLITSHICLETEVPVNLHCLSLHSAEYRNCITIIIVLISLCSNFRQNCSKAKCCWACYITAEVAVYPLVNHSNVFKISKLNTYNAWNVIDNNCCCCATVVHRSQTMIPFLSCCVPYIKLHSCFR